MSKLTLSAAMLLGSLGGVGAAGYAAENAPRAEAGAEADALRIMYEVWFKRTVHSPTANTYYGTYNTYGEAKEAADGLLGGEVRRVNK